LVLSEVEQDLLRVEEGRRVVPRRDPDLRRDRKVEQDARPLQAGRLEHARREPVHQGLAREQVAMISLVVVALLAQDPHDESAMFGGDEAPADAGVLAPGATPVEAAAATDGGEPSRDDTMLGAVGKNRFDTGEEKSDPLKIGGTLYLRAQVYWPENGSADKATFSSPDLLDVYL